MAAFENLYGRSRSLDGERSPKDGLRARCLLP